MMKSTTTPPPSPSSENDNKPMAAAECWNDAAPQTYQRRAAIMLMVLALAVLIMTLGEDEADAGIVSRHDYSGVKKHPDKKHENDIIKANVSINEWQEKIRAVPSNVTNNQTSKTSQPQTKSVVAAAASEASTSAACYLNAKTPLQNAKKILNLAHRYNNNDSTATPCLQTCLNQTVAHFDNTVSIQLASSTSSPLFHLVTITFQAWTCQGSPQSVGGDEFIVTIKTWSTETAKTTTMAAITLFKSAVPATDLGNGSYKVILHIPKHASIHSYDMTLMHYYTCSRGWKHLQRRRSTLELGPMAVILPPKFLKIIVENDKKGNNQTFFNRYQKLDECQTSQEGINQLLNGIWMEQKTIATTNDNENNHSLGLPNNILPELSLSAKWLPLCCRRMIENVEKKEKMSEQVSFVRIGDSTMPQQTIKLGDVYDNIKKPHHEHWLQYMLEQHEKQKEEPDKRIVTILTEGLHYLLFGYNPQAGVKLAIRMMCQYAAIVENAKLLFLGAAPIQQHLFAQVDMTDQHVLEYNARLTGTFLRAASSNSNDNDDNKNETKGPSTALLASLCRNNLGSRFHQLVSLPTPDGSLMSSSSSSNGDGVVHQVQIMAKRKGINDTTESIEYKTLKNLLLQKVGHYKSENWSEELYGNRTVWLGFADPFLRPRPETYREHDKIHDMLAIPGQGSLFFGAHSRLVDELLYMRSQG